MYINSQFRFYRAVHVHGIVTVLSSKTVCLIKQKFSECNRFKFFVELDKLNETSSPYRPHGLMADLFAEPCLLFALELHLSVMDG